MLDLAHYIEQQSEKTIKFKSILNYAKFLQFANYRIDDSSPHKVISELGFMFCVWNFNGDNQWVLKLPPPTIFIKMWFNAR